MAKEEPQSEVSWEEAVARYLEDNPGFFVDRPQLLSQLTLAHPGRGTAVSLIERQVDVLRDQSHVLQRQLRELVSNGRENEVIGHRLHDFACALLQANSLGDVLEVTRTRIRDKFRLDAVAMRVVASGDTVAQGPELVAVGEAGLEELVHSVNGGAPTCEAILSAPLRAQLFGDIADEIRSVVVVPLGENGSHGAMVLGSRDPHRFEAGMATDYLVRLGELVDVAVGKHL